MFSLVSPNMLKTYELCPRKFYLKYVKKISMPVNDDIFEFGKNIHALASYYLRGENIDKMEQSLTEKETVIWNYLKETKYFGYEVINTEYNLSVKIGNNFLGGRLDALVKNGETYFILDYKTGSAPKNAKFDYQTMIYILAVSKFFKTENVSFVYIDLQNKTEVRIDLTPDLISEYEKHLLTVMQKINNGEVPKKKKDCSCEYSLICF